MKTLFLKLKLNRQIAKIKYYAGDKWYDNPKSYLVSASMQKLVDDAVQTYMAIIRKKGAYNLPSYVAIIAGLA